MDVSLLVRLIDQVTEPAKKVGNALKGMAGTVGDVVDGAREGFGQAIREGFSVENVELATRNAEVALNNARGRLRGALGMGLALFAPVKVAADFETAMNQVSAVSGATGEQFDALRQQALDLGRTTQYTASQVADAMGFLAMAGLKTDEILGATPATLQLAAAAQMDLAQAADIVTNILAGYNKEVGDLAEVNDILVKAFTSSNTNLVQLGDAMKYAGPVAASAGIDFKETTAALGMMGNAGFQGTLGGTALRGAIVRLLSPTKQASKLMEEMGLSAEDMTDDISGLDAELEASAAAMKALGLQVTDSEGRMLPLVDIIRQLEGHADKTGVMMQLFGQRAGPAMIALLGQGSEAFEKFIEDLDNAAGTAQQVADVQMQGFNGMMRQIWSAVEGTTIAVGSMLIPVLVQLGAMIVPVINSMTDWMEANPELARGIVMATAALLGLNIALRLGAYLFAALRLRAIAAAATFLLFDKSGANVSRGWLMMASAGRVLAGALGLIKGVAVGIGALLAGISAPAWAAIAALVAAGFALWKYWDQISSFISGFASVFGDLIGAAVATALGLIDSLISKIGELLGIDEAAIEGFKASIAAMFDFSGLIASAQEALSAFWSWLGGFFSAERLSDEEKAGMEEAGRALAQSLVDGLLQALSDGWSAVEGWVLGKVEWLKSAFSFDINPLNWFGGSSDAGKPAASPLAETVVAAGQRSQEIEAAARQSNQVGGSIDTMLAGMGNAADDMARGGDHAERALARGGEAGGEAIESAAHRFASIISDAATGAARAIRGAAGNSSALPSALSGSRAGALHGGTE